jgi:hypothetical protein
MPYKDPEQGRNHRKEYYLKNKERILKNCSEYRKNNSDKLKKYFKQNYINNREEIRQKRKIYDMNNKEKLKIRKHLYYEKNKETISKKSKDYRNKNEEKLKIKNKIYRENNREILLEKKRLYRENNREQIRIKDRLNYHLHNEEIKQKRRRKNKMSYAEIGKLISKSKKGKPYIISEESDKIRRQKISIGGKIRFAKEKEKPSKGEILRREKIAKKKYKGGLKMANLRSRARRKQFGHENLNEPFENSHGHHIDKDHIVFIPKWLHKMEYHAMKKLETMERINTLVYYWLIMNQVMN